MRTHSGDTGEESSQRREGRDIRCSEIYPGASANVANAIEDIYDDQLDAVVLREAFPSDATDGALRRISNDAGLPWLCPNRTGPSADIRVLGVAATPSFETPTGPAVDTYFDAVEQYESVTSNLFGMNFDACDYIENLLGQAAGNRPVERLTNIDGRPFAACTVRSLPEGQCIILHHDRGHLDLPIYADVVSGLDTSIILSFFAVLQAPESDGRLIVHGVTDTDPVPRLANGYPDSDAIRRRYKFKAFELRARDVIIFGAGKYYHQVEPVGGPRPRVTLGGFLAFSRDRQKVYYWN